jgi:hypothetical protein
MDTPATIGFFILTEALGLRFLFGDGCPTTIRQSKPDRVDRHFCFWSP